MRRALLERALVVRGSADVAEMIDIMLGPVPDEAWDAYEARSNARNRIHRVPQSPRAACRIILPAICSCGLSVGAQSTAEIYGQTRMLYAAAEDDVLPDVRNRQRCAALPRRRHLLRRATCFLRRRLPSFCTCRWCVRGPRARRWRNSSARCVRCGR